MDLHRPLVLLAGLTPAQFMQRHWQRKPLLARAAWPGLRPPLSRAALFALAARDDVESRLVRRQGGRWTVRHGPLPRRALPPLKQPRWTLLVQGVDLHDDAAHRLLQPFRFVGDARLDDLMISYASDGGGVGPHLDAYDVFLLQVHGRRRWRIGRVRDRRCVDGAPLKLLRHFQPRHDWLLEPGDLLYLPPGWGHDGVAEGECMTASIGFRAPGLHDLARALMQAVADELADDAEGAPRYRDPAGAGTTHPARIVPALQSFARTAWRRVARAPDALERALGQWLTEPKAQVWFERGGAAEPQRSRALRLDRRTRMLYDARHVYINGEALRATGVDAQCLHRLADERSLDAAQRARLGAGARAVVAQWLSSGWVHEH
ncbi:MAG: cupin domain-containing protein [Ideonella sp.]|nr:cupin domain-containing protein [Ideonella sp.]MCC7457488.1 cupin domain-containing protein [Nitrospira sp.]